MSEAGDQQRALERELRIQQLEEAVEALSNDRAQLLEEIRAVHLQRRSQTGLEGLARDAKARVRARLGGRRASGSGEAPVPALALSSLPVTAGTPVPVWSPAVDILGDVRAAMFADPPFSVSWDLELPPGCVVRGAATLRPGAWDLNRGGVDLTAQVMPLAGLAQATTTVLALDPAVREQDRRWVPWSVDVPAGGLYRLTLTVSVAEGASPDFAWAVVAEPRLEIPGLARRPQRAALPIPASVGTGPAIAILLPVHDPDPGLLDRTLASVLAQSSSAWELCIVDDGSRDPLVRDRLTRAAASDHRVRLQRHETAEGISGATNAALALATAPYVATLDHDDLLAPDAIATIAAELAAHPATDVLYTDNDLVAAQRRRFAAALKPDWSPDLLRSCMFTLHLSTYRRSLVEEVGGWRSAFDGAQDHDLVLRLTERTEHVRHVPRVLAHWRAHAGSAALGELAKPEAYERGRAAVAEHLKRIGREGATVERLPQAGRLRVRYRRTWPVRVHLRVSEETSESDLAAAVEQLQAVLRPEDAVVRPGSGDLQTDGPHVDLYLDGLLVPDSADAIDELAGHVEAGAVAAGGLVVDPAGQVVAGGVAFPQGLPVALHVGADANADDRHPSLTMVTNRLAVAGAVAVPGGQPEPSSAPLGLVALSLSAADRGRVVWSPHARFTATSQTATALTTWPVAAAVALDRGARRDPFWNPLRWADSGAELVPESVHENPLLDVADA